MVDELQFSFRLSLDIKATLSDDLVVKCFIMVRFSTSKMVMSYLRILLILYVVIACVLGSGERHRSSGVAKKKLKETTNESNSDKEDSEKRVYSFVVPPSDRVFVSFLGKEEKGQLESLHKEVLEIQRGVLNELLNRENMTKTVQQLVQRVTRLETTRGAPSGGGGNPPPPSPGERDDDDDEGGDNGGNDREVPRMPGGRGLHHKLARLEENVADHLHEIHLQGLEIDGLKDKYSSMQLQVTDLLKMAAEQQDKTSGLISRVSDLEEKAGDFDYEFARMRPMVQEHGTLIAEHSESIGNIRETLSRLDLDTESLKSNVAKHSVDLIEFQNLRNSFRAEMERLHSNLSRVVVTESDNVNSRNVNSDIVALYADVRRIVGNMDRLNEALRELRSSNSWIKSIIKYNHLEMKLKQMEQSSRTLQHLLERINSTQRANKTGHLTRDLDRLQQTVLIHLSQVRSLNHTANSLRISLLDIRLREKLVDFQETVHDLSAVVHNLTNSMRALAIDVHNLTNRMEHLGTGESRVVVVPDNGYEHRVSKPQTEPTFPATPPIARGGASSTQQPRKSKEHKPSTTAPAEPDDQEPNNPDKPYPNPGPHGPSTTPEAPGSSTLRAGHPAPTEHPTTKDSLIDDDLMGMSTTNPVPGGSDGGRDSAETGSASEDVIDVNQTVQDAPVGKLRFVFLAQVNPFTAETTFV